MLQNVLCCLMMMLVPVGVAVPFLMALRLPPTPRGQRYPSRREAAALLTALCLTPLMIATLFTGWAFLLLTPAAILLVCTLLTAIAGRHPFLYSVLFSLFYAVSAVMVMAFVDPIEWEQDRALLQICFLVDPLIALIGATPLYFLWKSKRGIS